MGKEREYLFCHQRRWPRLLFIVKLKALIILAFCFQLSAKVHSQDKVTLKMEHASLEQVIWEIQKHTRFVFMYGTKEIEKVNNLTLNVTGESVDQILEKCLRNTDLIYKISGNAIVIKRKDSKKTGPIKGIVKDKKGQPLVGVTILLKGTEIKASTDKDGMFGLSVPDGVKAELVFSFIGMQRRSITYATYNENEPVVVTLEDEIKVVDEVVVTGFQTIRKMEMVGSVNTIKREDLFFNGTNTIEQMLQGKLPGMLVLNNSGLVGPRQKVRIRGTSTLLGNQEPVWVVDGIIQEDPIPFKAQELDSYGAITQDNFDMIRTFIGNSISWLNPNDIQDITILKDASATVLYGVKAANGVILITTKKGERGRISINYSGNTALTSRLTYEKMNLMNSKERIDVSREIYEKRLYGARYTEKVGYENAIRRYLNKEITYAEFDSEVKRLETVNTDWFDLLFQQPVSYNHSLNISGGTDLVRYYASLSTNKIKGAAKGNESGSNSASINLDAQLNRKIMLSMRLNGNVTKTNGFYQVDPYTYASTSSRAIPAFDTAGGLSFYEKGSSSYKYNVLNELANTGNENDTRNFNSYLNLKYDVFKGLRFESILGFSSSNAVGESFASERSYYIAAGFRNYDYGKYAPGETEYKASRLPHGGELNTTEARTSTINWRNSLSYNQLFGKHRISFLLGEESRSTKVDGASSTVFGYFPDRGKNVTLPPPTVTIGGTMYPNGIYNGYITSRITDRKSNFMSVFGSGTYSYLERYVATGSIRWDASNRFGQNTQNRFLPVWSAGVRWNVHNEDWMKDQHLISELNFRATYGWQGNVAENFGPELIAQIPYTPIEYYSGEFSLQIKSLPYADLRWEKTKTINLGVDLGIIKNRFMLSFEYYRKKSEDVIIYKEVAAEYGVATMPINGGNMLNQGLELQLSGTALRTKNWLWTLTLNTSRNINRVETAFPTATWWQGAVSGTLNKIGYPVSSFWAFQYKGPNPQTGVPEFVMPTAAENPKAITDVTEYMKYMGKFEPDFYGGLSTLVRYKTFSLSTAFNVNIGGKKFLYNMFPGNFLPSAYDNLPKEFVNRWRKPGDEKFTSIPTIPSMKENGNQNVLYFPSGYVAYPWNMYNNSDARVVNASFLRCNNISLSYNLQEKLLAHLFMKNLALSLSVSNPFIIVSKEFKGMDPEVATGNQPIAKTWSLGLNASF